MLNALLNTPHFDEEVAMNMGATINQITGYMFSKMEFTVPSIDEQDRIGTYFEHLDNLKVKANQMIAEALNNVSKGYVSYVGTNRKPYSSRVRRSRSKR